MSDKEDRSGGLFRRRPTESVSCAYVYICTCVLLNMCTCMYVHVYMCTCMYVHMYMCIYIYVCALH